jgi:hypothetical protein
MKILFNYKFMIIRKIISIFSISILFISSAIVAQENSSKFRHPLNVQAIGLYTKIQVEGTAWERRNGEEYQKSHSGKMEGELKAFNNLSFALNSGYTNFHRTDSGSYKGQERISGGVKAAWEGENWLFGMGVFGSTRDTTIPKSESYNPNLYLVRPYLGGGIRFLGFQALINLEYQSETNSKFKERYNEEFQRHYKAGASLGYSFTDSWTIFLEAETRVPYNKNIDKNIRYGNVYPGFSYKSESWGTIALSGGIPVIDDRLFDRQMKLSYFYFW